jgi:hypothetical protein
MSPEKCNAEKSKGTRAFNYNCAFEIRNSKYGITHCNGARAYMQEYGYGYVHFL